MIPPPSPRPVQWETTTSTTPEWTSTDGYEEESTTIDPEVDAKQYVDYYSLSALTLRFC